MKSIVETKIGEVIKQRRISIPLTLYELSNKSGVSQSHIGRIERGERFPSAHVLQKIAKPLRFGEDELFTLAGFLSDSSTDQENKPLKIDPLVANVLSCEPVEVQRAVIGILSLIKVISRAK